jgi:hypothetical protein
VSATSPQPAVSDVRRRARITLRLRRSVGQLSTAALQRMDREMPWFRDLGAQERSWIGMVVQAGMGSFVDWYANPTSGSELRAEVFGNAPQAFAGQISLQRTVAMVRLSIEVVEENVVDVLGEDDAVPVIEAITRYGREVAFATAEVYARAAEMRGAWDARLEALAVDSVLRGETDGAIESRASALGWSDHGAVLTLVGPLPDSSGHDATAEVRRIAHDLGLRSLCAAQGDRLVVILGGPDVAEAPLGVFAELFGDGPVIVGPVVDGLTDVPRSSAAALAGYRSVAGWADAPRPVDADDLLPERALSGDEQAIAHLVTEIHRPLVEAGPVVLDTLQCYLDRGSSLEGTARVLFVHANTVRYRLRRAHEVTGLNPNDPRDAYTLRVALTVGRLRESPAPGGL